MPHIWSRTVPCRDLSGRDREAIVFLDEDGSVGISVPAGEVARFHPETTAQVLRDAVGEAVIRYRGLA